MSNSDKLIVVTGATGQQGGATAKHLLKQGWRVRGLTRDVQGAAAQALAAAGAEVIAGNMDDRASLDHAFAGRTASSACRTSGCRRLARPARCARGRSWPMLPRQPVSGISSTRRWAAPSVRPGCSHFDSKWQIEEYIRSLGLPATILRPVFFMENLTSPMMGPRDGVLANALKPTTSLQMIAVEDIGFFAALAFARPQEFTGKAIELAGDSL